MTNRLEGFWYSEDEPDFPKPKPHKKAFGDKKLFLRSLRKLQNKLEMRRFKGYSHCRLCSNSRNGSGEYSHNGWTWPEGFEHYVDEHNVKPSEDFIVFILGGGKKQKEKKVTKPDNLNTVIQTINEEVDKFTKTHAFEKMLAQDFTLILVRELLPKFFENFTYSSGAAPGFWVDAFHKAMIKHFEERATQNKGK